MIFSCIQDLYSGLQTLYEAGRLRVPKLQAYVLASTGLRAATPVA